jgi:hypothetical protein
LIKERGREEVVPRKILLAIRRQVKFDLRMTRTEESGFEFVEHDDIKRMNLPEGEFRVEFWGIAGEIGGSKNSFSAEFIAKP